MPSEWEEAFGLVAIEAMALRVAPVARRTDRSPSSSATAHDGVLFTAGDANTLAAVVRDIETDPGRFSDLGRNARLSYEQRFDPDANIAQLVATYEFAMANRSGRRS